MRLAQTELGTPDDSLPDPENIPIDNDELELTYNLWTLWAATDKRYLPSQLIPEMLSGYGRQLSNLLEMNSLYEKVKVQLKKQMPNDQSA